MKKSKLAAVVIAALAILTVVGLYLWTVPWPPVPWPVQTGVTGEWNVKLTLVDANGVETEISGTHPLALLYNNVPFVLVKYTVYASVTSDTPGQYTQCTFSYISPSVLSYAVSPSSNGISTGTREWSSVNSGGYGSFATIPTTIAVDGTPHAIMYGDVIYTLLDPLASGTYTLTFVPAGSLSYTSNPSGATGTVSLSQSQMLTTFTFQKTGNTLSIVLSKGVDRYQNL